jgi:hypothetical protein
MSMPVKLALRALATPKPRGGGRSRVARLFVPTPNGTQVIRIGEREMQPAGDAPARRLKAS